eukprot:CAMPEP_0178442440 /NCGR_PEP_ID=MMETSP0689_2-20121128/38157_1 /TAXON_ID=160604 /ORGANISM="Amphidinium massartii, Strain CS-259" /LENGTH=564 /DNA_ID=CAMNT_0020065969 /DNA_START=24 /DNA_END=1718 /DNA_ORIENTATION=-
MALSGESKAVKRMEVEPKHLQEPVRMVVKPTIPLPSSFERCPNPLIAVRYAKNEVFEDRGRRHFAQTTASGGTGGIEFIPEDQLPLNPPGVRRVKSVQCLPGPSRATVTPDCCISPAARPAGDLFASDRRSWSPTYRSSSQGRQWGSPRASSPPKAMEVTEAQSPRVAEKFCSTNFSNLLREHSPRDGGEARDQSPSSFMDGRPGRASVNKARNSSPGVSANFTPAEFRRAEDQAEEKSVLGTQRRGRASVPNPGPRWSTPWATDSDAPCPYTEESVSSDLAGGPKLANLARSCFQESQKYLEVEGKLNLRRRSAAAPPAAPSASGAARTPKSARQSLGPDPYARRVSIRSEMSRTSSHASIPAASASAPAGSARGGQAARTGTSPMRSVVAQKGFPAGSSAVSTCSGISHSSSLASLSHNSTACTTSFTEDVPSRRSTGGYSAAAAATAAMGAPGSSMTPRFAWQDEGGDSRRPPQMLRPPSLAELTVAETGMSGPCMPGTACFPGPGDSRRNSFKAKPVMRTVKKENAHTPIPVAQPPPEAMTYMGSRYVSRKSLPRSLGQA